MIYEMILKLFVFCCLSLVFTCGELIVLDDSTFEHLTQAATGATTGDWFVYMVPESKCVKCKETEALLENLAGDDIFKGRMSFAKLNVQSSRITLRRFQITKPTIYYFYHGYQIKYNGALTLRSLTNFLKDGFHTSPRQPVKKQLDRFDVWQEDFIKEVKSAYKERRVPEKSVILVLLAGGVIALILISCVLPSKKGEEEKKQQRRQKKR